VDYPPLGGPINPITGGDQYREWIETCCPYTVSLGDSLQLEPGGRLGRPLQGVQDLIAQDPSAYWDPDNNAVRGRPSASALGSSGAVLRSHPAAGAGPPVTCTSRTIAAFFIESADSASEGIHAYFMQLSTPGAPCDPNAQSFLIGLALIE